MREMELNLDPGGPLEWGRIGGCVLGTISNLEFALHQDLDLTLPKIPRSQSPISDAKTPLVHSTSPVGTPPPQSATIIVVSL